MPALAGEGFEFCLQGGQGLRKYTSAAATAAERIGNFRARLSRLAGRQFSKRKGAAGGLGGENFLASLELGLSVRRSGRTKRSIFCATGFSRVLAPKKWQRRAAGASS